MDGKIYFPITLCSRIYDHEEKQISRTGSFDTTEFWLNRIIVQNGLEVYCTWTIVASFVNSTVAAQFSSGTPTDVVTGPLVAVSMLLVSFVIWFPFEVTKFDRLCRYAVTQYLGKFIY